MSRVRNYVFTYYAETDEQTVELYELWKEEGLFPWPGLIDTCQYLIIGLEVCTNSDKHHLQGYVELTKALSMDSFKKKTSNRIHVESRRGTPQEASDYCKKDGDYHEFGAMKRQGQRTDLDEIKSLLDDGVAEREIAKQYFAQWCQYRRSFASYVSLKRKDRDWETEVIVLWGTTGTGKTRRAHEAGAEMLTWSGNFMLGYTGANDVVCIDDFIPSQLPLPVFLRLMDRYRYIANIKTDEVNWNPRVIYITSNEDPATWYSATPQAAAVQRRLTQIWSYRAGVSPTQTKPYSFIDLQPLLCEETLIDPEVVDDDLDSTASTVEF